MALYIFAGLMVVQVFVGVLRLLHCLDETVNRKYEHLVFCKRSINRLQQKEKEEAREILPQECRE